MALLEGVSGDTLGDILSSRVSKKVSSKNVSRGTKHEFAPLFPFSNSAPKCRQVEDKKPKIYKSKILFVTCVFFSHQDD